MNQKKPWVLPIIAIVFLIYFIIARYVWDVKHLIELLSNQINVSQIERSVAFSKVLLLDMCPLMAVLLPITTLFDKNKVVAKILCPVTIIGSCITIFGQVIWEAPDISQFFEYTFIGLAPNRMYFMMHFLSLVLSIMVLNCAKKYNWWSLFFSIIFYVIWFAYVQIVSKALNITSNVTGLVEYDWVSEYGQYHKVYLLWKLPFPAIVVFWYTMALIANFIIAIIKNLLTYNPNKVTYIKERRFFKSSIFQP